MALFSFGDIKFLSKSNASSAAHRLTENSDYQSNIFRYPIDIGEADKGHYMVIHINEQRATSFKSPGASDSPTVIENIKTGKSISRDESFAGTIKNINALGEKVEELSGVKVPKISSFSRTIQRTTDTIALYMPDTVAYTQNQVYSDLNLTGSLAAASSAISSLVDKSKTENSLGFKELISSLLPFLAQRLQGSDILRAGFAATTGTVINPMLDLIYTSPAFREFRFDFMFYPRSEMESMQVQKIINRLNFHQAPEFLRVGDGGSSFFMVPPSEFDIKFYYNGRINPNIPPISTCVLTSIDVDYAPNGFSAYEVHGESDPKMGRTGMPVAIRMSLQFKETEVLSKHYFYTPETQQEKMLREQEEGM
jgi:hypothetical protein